MNKLILIVLFFLSLFLTSCQTDTTWSKAGFYHWQTNFSLSNLEHAYLDSLHIHKLYIKFFDVDWDANRQQAVPSAELIWNTKLLEQIEIIPTVFITNRTLTNTTEGKVEELADKIYQKINELVAGKEFFEFQIDCDWTKSTKEKYLLLLQRLRELSPNQQLSATIRLHQVKFQEDTGIPPVDRGMLMYYNIGDINDWQSENSIYEPILAEPYLARMKKYPLELDIVLPLFHWGLIYRDKKLFKIINNLGSLDLEDKERFDQTADNRYEVVKATYLKGHYLYEGDKIRLESINEEQLYTASQQLMQSLPNKERTIAFYHLDEVILRNWEMTMLVNILKQHQVSQLSTKGSQD
ncbi:MAG: hypothetical protein AAFO82_04700 [Bacteroidota bacterium]